MAMGIKKDSNLLGYGRFGIGPLLLGSVATWFSVRAIREFPLEGNAWVALTLSVTMTCCGLGTIMYGAWLDWRRKRKAVEVIPQ